MPDVPVGTAVDHAVIGGDGDVEGEQAAQVGHRVPAQAQARGEQAESGQIDAPQRRRIQLEQDVEIGLREAALGQPRQSHAGADDGHEHAQRAAIGLARGIARKPAAHQPEFPDEQEGQQHRRCRKGQVHGRKISSVGMRQQEPRARGRVYRRYIQSASSFLACCTIWVGVRPLISLHSRTRCDWSA